MSGPLRGGNRPDGQPHCMVVPAEAARRRFVPFFAASLVLALLPGVSLGALSLFKLTGTWGMLSRSWVWAHGYAQVFGFLALFVFGFAYHAVPRFVGAELQHRGCVNASLACQLAGVVSILAAFLAPVPAPARRALWVLGSVGLLSASGLFATVLVGTLRARSAPVQSFERWMLAGAAWLTAGSATALVAAFRNDITWHHVLWPAGLYGFAGSWIFGAGCRLFGSSLGWRRRWPALDRPVFLLYQAGVLAWCVGAWPQAGPFRIARGLGAAALLAAVAGYAASIGWLRSGSTLALGGEFRSYERWVHAGWFWLLVALACGPGWSLSRVLRNDLDSITMLDLSRHALGLGFASHMIIGIGGRFVPVFCGTALWSPAAHRATWWLLNISLAIRALEAPLAAGHWPAAWPFLALSGPPALAGFGLFSANIFAAILGRGRPLTIRRGVAGGRTRLRVLAG